MSNRGGANDGNGGAISFFTNQTNPDSLSITNSTISNNEAERSGGAIFVSASPTGGTSSINAVTIVNSTISGNSAGQIDNNVSISGGNGGGIFVTANTSEGGTTSLTVDLTNSTIANNTARGGGKGSLGDAGGVLVDNSTTDVTVTLNINNTVIANNNQDGTTASADLQTSSVVGLNVKSSLIEDTSTGFGSNAATELDASVLQQQDPLLGTLADNGGTTMTHLPQDGSPLIDAGDSSLATAASLTLDQRGETRVNGASVDIGSVEFTESSTSTTAPTTSSSSSSSSAFSAIWLIGLGLLAPLMRRRKQ